MYSYSSRHLSLVRLLQYSLVMSLSQQMFYLPGRVRIPGVVVSRSEIFINRRIGNEFPQIIQHFSATYLLDSGGDTDGHRVFITDFVIYGQQLVDLFRRRISRKQGPERGSVLDSLCATLSLICPGISTRVE